MEEESGGWSFWTVGRIIYNFQGIITVLHGLQGIHHIMRKPFSDLYRYIGPGVRLSLWRSCPDDPSSWSLCHNPYWANQSEQKQTSIWYDQLGRSREWSLIVSRLNNEIERLDKRLNWIKLSKMGAGIALNCHSQHDAKPVWMRKNSCLGERVDLLTEVWIYYPGDFTL